MTGALSGAFGVGGGFLVVPAFLVVLRVDMAVALATSLVSIFLISVSGLAANTSHLHAADSKLAATFLIGAAAGMTVGVFLKKQLPGPGLKTVFGWAVIGTAGFMAVRSLLTP